MGPPLPRLSRFRTPRTTIKSNISARKQEAGDVEFASIDDLAIPSQSEPAPAPAAVKKKKNGGIFGCCSKSNPKKNIVFVLGGPGSGKGTQCAKLVEAFNYLHISAGDLLRAEVASGSPTAELINGYIKEGKIVPSSITVALLSKAIESSEQDTVLVDGFPRALDQIDEFKRVTKLDCDFVLFFDCPEDLLTQRLLKRGETSGRADDNLESIQKRFTTFREQSYPVVEQYGKLNKVRRVDSSQGTPDGVFQKVKILF